MASERFFQQGGVLYQTVEPFAVLLAALIGQIVTSPTSENDAARWQIQHSNPLPTVNPLSKDRAEEPVPPAAETAGSCRYFDRIFDALAL